MRTLIHPSALNEAGVMGSAPDAMVEEQPRHLPRKTALLADRNEEGKGPLEMGGKGG